MIKKHLMLVALTFVSISSIAESNGNMIEGNDEAKYVSIHIEIKELKESGVILRKATNELATALNTISADLGDRSPEQLLLINELADKVGAISKQLNATIHNLPNTIRETEKPAAKILQNSLAQIKEETISPLVSKIELWIVISIAGLCILALVLLIAYIYSMKKISNMGVLIKDIADGYRIIPVEQYKTSQKEMNP